MLFKSQMKTKVNKTIFFLNFISEKNSTYNYRSAAAVGFHNVTEPHHFEYGITDGWRVDFHSAKVTIYDLKFGLEIPKG